MNIKSVVTLLLSGITSYLLNTRMNIVQYIDVSPIALFISENFTFIPYAFVFSVINALIIAIFIGLVTRIVLELVFGRRKKKE